MKKILGYFAIATLGGFASLGLNYYLKTDKKVENSALTQTQPIKTVAFPLSTPENTVNFTEAANLSVHAVVHVKTSYEVSGLNNYMNDPFYNFFYGNPLQNHPPVEQTSAGSGVIISNDGYIVTNNHVIGKAEKIEVTLNDRRTYEAKIIGKDPATDLALLKIEEKNLPFLSYGNSDEVKIGEWVLAVGNPFNLTSTVTAGIVSAKARNINIIQGSGNNIPSVESFIQTDAAVNPGNSGGALVSTSGQLIGINTAIASNTGSYTGYSFAIPVNIVRKIVADLLEFGEAQRGFIGIQIQDVDSKLAKDNNLAQVKGVYVKMPMEGGAAEKAGIKPGDVIVKIADREVNNVPELQEQVSRYRPGDKIAVTVIRDNKESVLSLILKNKDGDTGILKKERVEVLNSLGASFESLNEAEKKQLKITNGVKISNIQNGLFRNLGIKEGFILTNIDKKKINSPEDVKAALENKSGGVLLEGIYPNGTKKYFAFGL